MKTTTNAKEWRFKFTISDTARFLGKSPVTLRAWERKGEITYPRESTDRVLTTDAVRRVAQEARRMGRISQSRLRLVEAALTMIELVERENNK